MKSPLSQTKLKTNVSRVILEKEVAEVSGLIAPLWPLENAVAVNPWMGMAHKPFTGVAAQMRHHFGIPLTLSRDFYRKKVELGELTEKHIAEVLPKFPRSLGENPADLLTRLWETQSEEVQPPNVPSVAEVAAVLYDKDWVRFSVNRLSSWAASYFDNGQAKWKVVAGEGIYEAWKKEAAIDRTPEVSGLKSFRKRVASLPEDPWDAIAEALTILDIPAEIRTLYFHKILLTVGGWSAHVARLDWDDRLYGKEGGRLSEWLAVLLSFEVCLYQSLYSEGLEETWSTYIGNVDLESNLPVPRALEDLIICQSALDEAKQQQLFETFNASAQKKTIKKTAAKIQAIFCIDVRSEVFRRNLERINEEVETLGFAGFFAFPIKYMPIGQEEGEAQCPVLLPTGPTIKESLPDQAVLQQVTRDRRERQQGNKIWAAFRSGAITCFSFVSPLGMTYLAKLISDSFGWSRPVPHPSKVGLRKEIQEQSTVDLQQQTKEAWTTGISLEDQISMAKNALRAMSLTEGFGEWVMITGHGSTSVNNPHATGLDCGACGGHTGEANAKVAAAVLNNPQVRDHLQVEGIIIPKKTIFLACLHDTTTDEVTIYNQHTIPSDRKEDLESLKQTLAKASKATRAERALRFALDTKGNSDREVLMRSKDWSQVRPEWGLAGCSAFLVAPREHSQHLDLGGKSFLHSYNWKKDEGFKVLELIMTAPMVVGSWISLQYYASVVAPQHFGAGNKTLHNITAGLGVFEGFSGDLRVGLPWQSVHDGENYQHEPLRLQVVIAAPREAMNEVLKIHQNVRDLCDNEWLYLSAMNDEGKITHRYAGDLEWREFRKC